jgi:DNA-binding NtrC family response regulator
MPNAPGLLLVDDESMLLQLLEIIFSREGYRVFTCTSGQSAIDLFRREHQHIDLVLLDVCMPEIDGPQTLQELQRIQPSVRACFMSGFTGVYGTEALLGMGALRLFDKPFQIETLIQDISQLIHSEAQRRAA